jgi:hypothetical protein
LFILFAKHSPIINNQPKLRVFCSEDLANPNKDEKVPPTLPAAGGAEAFTYGFFPLLSLASLIFILSATRVESK